MATRAFASAGMAAYLRAQILLVVTDSWIKRDSGDVLICRCNQDITSSISDEFPCSEYHPRARASASAFLHVTAVRRLPSDVLGDAILYTTTAIRKVRFTYYTQMYMSSLFILRLGSSGV